MKNLNEIIYLIGIALIIIILYPFIWIYETFGIFWLIVAIFTTIFLISKVYLQYQQKVQKNFEQCILYEFEIKHNTPDDKIFLLSVKDVSPILSLIIQNIQIIRESIYISISTKNRDTAESRHSVVYKIYDDFLKEYSHMISDETLSKINLIIEKYEYDYHTLLYINIANGYIQKANNLKTLKSKAKYIELAINTLEEGLNDPLSDKDILNQKIAIENL